MADAKERQPVGRNEIELSISRQIERDGVKVTEYLTAARTWTDKEDEGLFLRFKRIPTNRDNLRIEARCHDLVGMRRWIEISTTARDGWALLLARYRAQLWPEGIPKTKTKAEDKAQWAQIEAAYRADRSELAEGYRIVAEQADKQRFLAMWPVMVLDPPKGWENIDDMPDDPPGLLDVLIERHRAAVELNEATQGN